MRQFVRRWLRLLAGMLLIALCAAPVFAQGGGGEAGAMGGIRDRLAPPPLSDPPTTIEQGHYDYYLYCMVCHGDRGQGLTEEWRNAGDPADANCWQSRCHASNHPPGGFELPRYAPPVIGEYALTRFATVGELQQYIQQSMPWHIPGLLEEDQYQRIALYLAQANGVDGLNGKRAWNELASQPASVRAQKDLPESPPQPRAGLSVVGRTVMGRAVMGRTVIGWIALSLLGAGMVSLAAVWRRRRSA